MLAEWAPLASSDPTVAARFLLGCRLRAGDVEVRLTEVEAYGGVGLDPASHAFGGQTRRNAVMFGPPGVLYVYFVFGMHWCLNVVCGPPGEAAAVLLRAGEVTSGLSQVRERRGDGPARDLARGPARLATALGVTGSANATNLLDGSGPLALSPGGGHAPTSSIASGPRVGVAVGASTPWRFWLSGEPSVSAYRRHAKAPNGE